MANIEARYIARVITGTKQDAIDAKKFTFEPSDFHLLDREYEFITVFQERYGKYPDKLTFAKKFPSFRWPKCPESALCYGDALVERSNKFKAVRALKNVQGLFDSAKPGDVNKAIAQLSEVFTSCLADSASSVLDMKKTAKDRLTEYRRRRQNLKSGKSYDSPFPKLNRMIPTGFVPQNLITLMSRTNVGKTWVLALFALYWWKKYGAKVLFVSKEMTEDEIRDRLDALAVALNWIRFMRGRLKPDQLRAYKEWLRKSQKLKNTIIVAGDANLSEGGLESLVALIEQHKPDCVLVDGLAQYDGKGKSEPEKMKFISNRMKRIAKAKKVVLMQSIHANRAAEGKKQGGGLAAASWSDSLAGDADFFFELIAPEGRESKARLFKNLKGRNSGFGEFWLDLRVKPRTILVESTKTRPEQQKVKLGGVK